jgi:hypothetical protein
MLASPFQFSIWVDGTSAEGEVEEEGNRMGRGLEYRLRFSWCRDRKRKKTLTIGLHTTSASLREVGASYHCLEERARQRHGVGGMVRCQAACHGKGEIWRDPELCVARSLAAVAQILCGTSITASLAIPSSSATSMAPVPASLKPIQQYLNKANEMKNADPVVSYYCTSFQVNWRLMRRQLLGGAVCH